MLDQLPEDVLVNIVSGYLDPDCLNETLATLAVVCHAWMNIFHGKTRPNFWVLLGQSHGVSIRPRCRKPHQYLWRCRQQMKKAVEEEVDQFIINLCKQINQRDSPTLVRRRIQSLDRNMQEMVLKRAVPSLEHRNLLHMAAWYGCNKVVMELLYQRRSYQSHARQLVLAQDDNGATPLLIAAWAGHTRVVGTLLYYLIHFTFLVVPRRREFLQTRSMPPQSSSCGGKGHKTTLQWAHRKGHRHIVRKIEEAMEYDENVSSIGPLSSRDIPYMPADRRLDFD